MYDMWRITILAVLCVIAAIDMKTQTIPVTGVIVLGLLAMVQMVRSYDSVELVIIALVPGVIFLALSLATRNKIGVGDAILVAEIGIAMGLEQCTYIIMFALMMCCFVSVFLLVLKKVSRHTTIPFAPFLAAGMGVIMYAYK